MKIPIGNIEDIQLRERQLEIEKMLSLEKALKSDDVNEIMKAQNYLQTKKSSGVEPKTVLIDPYDITGTLGYKDKPQSVSYDLLRGMAKTHVIKSIIETRKDQVISFCSPQAQKYSTGFVIRKRLTLNPNGKQKKLTKEEEKEIEELTMFILNCGNEEESWSEDTFETFTKKVLDDSLTLDQCTFEIVRNEHTNEIQRFLATDGGTMRISDTYGYSGTVEGEQWKKNYTQKEVINGYLPTYVQIIDGKPRVDYYPWELCFGVRNPSSNIKSNGYGRSELEDMIQTVTALLNSDYYNSNFFKVGSAPKGILRYTGNINETTLQDFRAQWMAQTAGVLNMHKVPLINADKIDFIPTHVPNKDMEFSKFQEFLIKISCALYKIDPSEIGFPMSGSSDSKPMFEGNNEARLKYSRDKGLKPLLKQYQYWINKYLVWPKNKEYEFVFVGIEGETTFEQELDNDIKQLQYFKTLNEIREERNLDPLPYGDMVLNPIVYQKISMDQMNEQQQGMMGEGQEQMMGGEMSTGGGGSNPFEDSSEDYNTNENPFMKSLEKELGSILN